MGVIFRLITANVTTGIDCTGWSPAAVHLSLPSQLRDQVILKRCSAPMAM